MRPIVSLRSLRAALGAGLVTVALAAAPAAADDAGALYKQGISWKNQGKDDEAIAAFEKAVAADAKHGMAWASLGHLYKKKKMFPQAVDAYEHATQILTKDATVWSNLGMAYYRVDRLDDALASYDRAIALRPGYGEAHYNRGNALMALKRPPEALAAFDAWSGPLKPHVAYGELDKAQYTRAHLMHLADHWTLLKFPPRKS